ncbi:MAG TPA: restriction endonuclease subunit S [Alphaproteobacteria bacterium]|nr:restriction endonuclease subunit S [Alphaproteobacteria bacterium]
MQNIIQCFKKMKLSECFTFLVGGDVDKLCFSETKDDMHPYPIYANALTNKGLYGYSSKYKIKDECITITGRGDIGNVFYRKGFFTPIVRLIVAIPRENINAKFMSYACSKIRFFNETTGVPQLTVPQVQGHKVLVPPLAEQEKIAEILGTWDSAIEKLTALIAAKRLQKKGMMQKLLTAQIRLPGFTGEWQKVKLGEITVQVTKSVGTLKIPTASISSKTGFVLQEEKFGRDISGEQYSKYTLIEKGDFSYNKGNSKTYPQGCAYRLKQFNQIAVPNVFISFKTINDLVCPSFLEQFFMGNFHGKLLRRVITSSVRDNGLLNLSVEDFFGIEFELPPLSEQKTIADILSKADEEIDLLTRKLDLLKSQKKGLMQQLLTGKIRVKVA